MNGMDDQRCAPNRPARLRQRPVDFAACSVLIVFFFTLMGRDDSALRLQLHRRNDAAVYYGVLEGKCRSVVAPLGFGTVVFAFSNRLCLLPQQITSSPKKSLDLGDGWMLVGFTSFHRIEDNAREHPVPDLPELGLHDRQQLQH